MGAGGARHEALCDARMQQRRRGSAASTGQSRAGTASGWAPQAAAREVPPPRTPTPPGIRTRAVSDGQRPPAGVSPAPAHLTVLGAAWRRRGGGRLLGSRAGTPQSPVGPRWPNTTKSSTQRKAAPRAHKDHPSWGRNTSRQGRSTQGNKYTR